MTPTKGTQPWASLWGVRGRLFHGFWAQAHFCTAASPPSPSSLRPGPEPGHPRPHVVLMSFPNRRRILERLSIIETRAQRAHRQFITATIADQDNNDGEFFTAPDDIPFQPTIPTTSNHAHDNTVPSAPDQDPDTPAPVQDPTNPVHDDPVPVQDTVQLQAQDPQQTQVNTAMPPQPTVPPAQATDKHADPNLITELTSTTYASWLMGVRHAARKHGFVNLLDNDPPSNPTEAQKDALADVSALLVSKISRDTLQEMSDVMDEYNPKGIMDRLKEMFAAPMTDLLEEDSTRRATTLHYTNEDSYNTFFQKHIAYVEK